jgi:putative transposase
VAARTRDLLRQICQGREVVIVQGAVSPEHVHMLVSVTPQLAPVKLVQYLKGRSSRMVQDEFPQLRKRYWGQHLWAQGVFLCECGRGGRRPDPAIH